MAVFDVVVFNWHFHQTYGISFPNLGVNLRFQREGLICMLLFLISSWRYLTRDFNKIVNRNGGAPAAEDL